ncbi:thioredoxin domain-containing protein 6 isoform X7 [Halichoerus grypus]
MVSRIPQPRFPEDDAKRARYTGTCSGLCYRRTLSFHTGEESLQIPQHPEPPLAGMQAMGSKKKEIALQGGELVAVVRGANAPLLQKTIREQLEAEKKVLAEGRERKVIRDEALSDEDGCLSHDKDNGEDVDVASSGKTCTLAIIKPDAVVHGKTDEIIMKIHKAGFDILANEERTMTEAEMQLFYQHKAGEEAFEKLVHHMCSGPSHLLILTRPEGTEDVTAAWRTLMGPCDPDVARREQPDSLRAQFGTEMPFNAVHGSQDRDAASRELALLFPTFKFSDEVLEASLGHGAEGAAGPTEARRFPEDMD